jgi:hypothetical protein
MQVLEYLSEVLMDIVAALKREEAKLQKQLTGIQGAIRELVGVSSNGNSTSRKKRGISAAGRARIAAAQRKRWAKIKRSKKG